MHWKPLDVFMISLHIVASRSVSVARGAGDLVPATAIGNCEMLRAIFRSHVMTQ